MVVSMWLIPIWILQANLPYLRLGLQPYYNTTERMKRGFLNSHGLERLMKNALALLQEPLAETLPPQLVEEHHLMSLDEAIRNIHLPQESELLRKAQYRLKFEELFYVQLNILRYSKDRQRKYRGLRLNGWVRSLILLFTESSF